MQDTRGSSVLRDAVPRNVRASAAWAAAALVIGAVVYLVVQFAAHIGVLVLTLLAALLLTALLRPLVDQVARTGLPRLAATWLVLLVAMALAAGVLLFIEQQLVAQLPVLRASLSGGLERVRDVLVQQLGIPPGQVDRLIETIQTQLRGAGGGAPLVTGARTAVTVLAGLALALFTTFWLMYDGERVWRFLQRLAPTSSRERVGRAGEAAWETLGGYLRGITLVALVDAAGIGIALLVLGVPLPFTLALLTFLGAYVPLIGAMLAGLAAVLVAFATEGATTALLTFGAVILVQQLEGQILQPVIMGRALELHPLAIAWALALGSLLWGIPGAIISVPLAAVLYSIGTVLVAASPSAAEPPESDPAPPESSDSRVEAGRDDG